METKDTLAQILKDAHLNVMHYDAKYPDAKERYKVEPDVAQKVDLIHRTEAVVREEFMERAYDRFANEVWHYCVTFGNSHLGIMDDFVKDVARILDVDPNTLVEQFHERYLAEYAGGGNYGE